MVDVLMILIDAAGMADDDAGFQPFRQVDRLFHDGERLLPLRLVVRAQVHEAAVLILFGHVHGHRPVKSHVVHPGAVQVVRMYHEFQRFGPDIHQAFHIRVVHFEAEFHQYLLYFMR